MTAHTFECGCYFVTHSGGASVTFCPLHAAARDMRDALEAICQDLGDGDYVSAEQIAKSAGVVALAKARGPAS